MEAKTKKSLKWTCIVTSVIIVGILLGVIAYIFASVKHFDQVFVQGLSIEGIQVGGLTKEEAYNLIHDNLSIVLKGQSIEIADEDTQYEISLSELGIKHNLEQVINESFEVGHVGNMFQKYHYAKGSLEEPIDFQVPYIYEESKIQQVLSEYAPYFYKAPIDATIERKNKSFIITPEISGKELNIEAVINQIIETIEQREFDKIIQVTKQEILPVHTAESLKVIENPISSFYTSYNNADRDRNTNLQVASAKINELLAPGEVFSLGEHLEPITAAEGYRESKVIVNGRIEEGIGGGVCQIASTLYNAVLLSNLDITVRQNHSLPVAYVPLGRDATYATGGIDFRFQNNSEYPVFIESYCENNRVYVNIFSHPSLKPPYDEIKFQSDTIEVIAPPPVKYVEDPELPKGAQVQELPPLEGKKVKLYKLFYKGGELIKKEVVDTSYYKPRGEVIKIGVKEEVAEAEPSVIPDDPLDIEGSLDIESIIEEISHQ